MKRRHFINLAGLALSASAFGSTFQSAASEKSPSRHSNSVSHGMRVGSDADKLYAVKKEGPMAVLDYIHTHGLDGAFFRTVLDLSPTLDEIELKEIKAHADSYGLYLECGVGWGG